DNTTEFQYDAKGNMFLSKDALGNATIYVYAANGDLQSITNPTGKTTQFTQYDTYGNAQSIIDPAGNETSMTYDSRGRLRTKDIKGGGTLLSHEVITYDDLDRKALDTVQESLFGAPSQVTKYGYYPNGGQLETITNPLNHVTHFYYEPKTN